MGSHIHYFKPGQSVTFEASADVIGGRVVEVSGDRKVAPSTDASGKVVGTAAVDAKAGDDVLVIIGGVQKLTSSAAFPAGARVKSNVGGKVSGIGSGDFSIGVALTATTGADQVAQILFN
ncbi:putative scaffolding protein [Rathayibacter phage NCPPB3778]|nr:putative scaffolding protein [Rathayibacter phage NCPPB3778]